MPIIDLAGVLGRARHCRERAGFVGKQPPYSTRRVVETCFPSVMVTGTDGLPRGCVELAFVGPSGQRTIFYRRGLAHPTQRVGIAHGLHHLAVDLRLGTSAECNLGLRELERRGNVEQDPIELACDVFAGELLVPTDVLDAMAPAALFPAAPAEEHHFLDEVDSLASRFNVPAGFLRWRLWDLLHLRRTNYNAR